MADEDPIFEFLRKRGIQEDIIEQMKQEKVGYLSFYTLNRKVWVFLANFHFFFAIKFIFQAFKFA